MQTTILCVGKQHESHIKPAVELYEKRLRQFSRPVWVYSPHAVLRDAEAAKVVESEALLKHLRQDDTVVLLDERGEQLSSPGFAKKVDRWQTTARGRLVFIIGGAYGVNERIFKRADFTWSLSSLVFPHQLVRVLLSEQLYRAHAINNLLPYHHE